MPQIRTVFHPDTIHEVDEHEAAQLAREGLLLPLEEEQPADAPAAAAEPAPKPAATPKATPTPAKEARPDGDEQAQ